MAAALACKADVGHLHTSEDILVSLEGASNQYGQLSDLVGSFSIDYESRLLDTREIKKDDIETPDLVVVESSPALGVRIEGNTVRFDQSGWYLVHGSICTVSTIVSHGYPGITAEMTGLIDTRVLNNSNTGQGVDGKRTVTGNFGDADTPMFVKAGSSLTFTGSAIANYTVTAYFIGADAGYAAINVELFVQRII